MSKSITIEKLYEELKQIESKMLTKRDIKLFVDTIEIMSNPDTMEQISKSKEDIKNGRVKEVSSVKDLIENA